MPNPGKFTVISGGSSEGPPPAPPSRVRGVTAANYAMLAKKFMAANAEDDGTRGFMIATKNIEIQGTKIPESLLQWKTWQSYFRKKRISHAWMRHTDHYMVPAEWPYLFDADETAPPSISSPPGPRYSSFE